MARGPDACRWRGYGVARSKKLVSEYSTVLAPQILYGQWYGLGGTRRLNSNHDVASDSTKSQLRYVGHACFRSTAIDHLNAIAWMDLSGKCGVRRFLAVKRPLMEWALKAGSVGTKRRPW